MNPEREPHNFNRPTRPKVTIVRHNNGACLWQWHTDTATVSGFKTMARAMDDARYCQTFSMVLDGKQVTLRFRGSTPVRLMNAALRPFFGQATATPAFGSCRAPSPEVRG